jgi:hypothetical protein
MKRLLPFLILILALSSCSLVKNLGLTPEEKAQNKAADYIEKALRLDPSAIEGHEVEIPVTLPIPERSGSIALEIESRLNADSLIAIVETAPDQAPRIIREILEMPCEVDEMPFEDSLLVGTFSIENGRALFDYTVKADSVSGSVTTVTNTINPTRHEKPGFFAKLEQNILFIIYLIIALAVGIGMGKWLL